jgi:hypothetical protein
VGLQSPDQNREDLNSVEVVRVAKSAVRKLEGFDDGRFVRGHQRVAPLEASLGVSVVRGKDRAIGIVVLTEQLEGVWNGLNMRCGIRVPFPWVDRPVDSSEGGPW